LQSFTNINLCFWIGVGARCIIDEDGALVIFLIFLVLVKIEVECDRLEQVEEALDAGADMLLLDNMDLSTWKEAVKIVNHKIPLEASGGVSLETIGDIAHTGVDFISVGHITQSSPSVDIGLDELL